MKILSVLIENLNSLQGKWYIDFTTQAFVDNGLFAITGPTGAGKSTILDAICIALYHETPRLSNLSKTNAEVMNKDKGYCSAEVRFEVQGKIYLAKWSIRRSRNQANGKLQAPTGTLTCETSQTDIATKLSDKVPAVVALTKLNFKRFTKSMMLSQGEFSAFLNAGDNDRSELLEQLTGTEIYSDISKRVFEEHKILKQQLALLQTSQSAKNILTESEINQLTAEITLAQAQVAVDQKQLDTLREHQYWWHQHTQLSNALLAAQTDVAEAESFQLEHQTNLAQLQLARPAHKIKPVYQRYVDLQKRCEQLQLSLAEQQEQIPTLTVESAAADSDFTQANNEHCKQIKLQKELNQLIDEHIIPLDNTISGQQEQARNLTSNSAQIQAKIEQLESALTNDNSALAAYQTQSQTITDYLSSHHADSQLTANIGIWKIEYQRLLTLTHSYSTDTSSFTTAVASVIDIDESVKDQIDYVAKINAEMTRSVANLSQIATAGAVGNPPSPFISAVLKEANTPNTITQATIAACARFYQTQIKPEQALLRLYDQLVVTQNTHQSLAQASATLQVRLTEQQAQLPALTKQAQSDQTMYELAKNNLSMQQQLARFSEQLEEHQTCPLCASAEFGDYKALHAHHNQQEAAGILTQQLTQYQEAHQASTAALNQLTQAIKTQESLFNSKCEEQALYLEQCTKLATQCRTQASELDISWVSQSPSMLPEDVPMQLHTRDKLRETLAELEQYVVILNQYQALTELATQITQQQERLLSEINAAGFTAITTINREGKFEQWLSQKDADLTLWQDNQAKQIEINKQISEISQRISFNTKSNEEAHANLKQIEKESNELEQSLTANITQRTTLFADTDPKQARLEAQAQVEQCATNSTTLQTKKHQLSQTLATLNTRIAKDIESLDQENIHLSAAQTQFTEVLASSVFSSEAEFRQACINDEALERLSNLEITVNTKLSETASVLKQAHTNKEQHLALEKAEYYLTVPTDAVSEQLTHQQTQLETYTTKHAQLKGRYEHNEKLERDVSHIKLQIVALQEHITTYDYLAELIGSSDGKKFRKFAQGLTLDNLIYLTNLQLADLDGRYELKRKDNQSLDMVVVDRWQGDTERDTRTLSGGESFLVSLALALGLSELVSQEISIDSLFLDEGFGTLDSDTLDTALDVLDTLNAKGKMIGVISHVEAMKQRIPLQIKITKQSGLGISTLDEEYRYTEALI